jgi:sugar phosphate isomerase/epimerase
MNIDDAIEIGVSPAYHISCYGDRFTSEDVARSLKDIRALGFHSFQLEVFHPDTLADWVASGSAIVAKAAEKNNIFPSQFIAHFLCHGFGSVVEINSEFGIEEIKSCLKILSLFPDCGVITIVIPAFRTEGAGFDETLYSRIWERLAGKLSAMATIAGDGGKVFALELMPGSIIGGLQGLVRLIDQIGLPNFGYNFDTGHAWVCHEAIELVSGILAGRIFGTHLRDNDQKENLSLPPGRGTIPWDILLKNLLASGYRRNFDLEIKCDSGDTASWYREGLDYISIKLHDYKEKDDYVEKRSYYELFEQIKGPF